MSIRTMTQVWEHADAKGATLLLLLALADYADDEGRNAWPSLARLAKRTRMSERQTRRILRELEAAGEVETTERPGTSSTYRLTIATRGNTPAKMTPKHPGQDDPPPGQHPGQDDRGGRTKCPGRADIAMTGEGGHSYDRGSVSDPPMNLVVDEAGRVAAEGSQAEISARLLQLGLTDTAALAARTTLCHIDHYATLAAKKDRPSAYIASCIHRALDPPREWTWAWQRERQADLRLTEAIAANKPAARKALEHWRTRQTTRTKKPAPAWMDLQAMLADPSPEGRKRRKSLACLIDPNLVHGRTV